MSEAENQNRAEERTLITVAIELAGENPAVLAELAFTENVSRSGARVLSKRIWQEHQSVLLAPLPGDFTSPARVIYCEPLPSGEHAVGLHLLQPAGNWILETRAPSTER